MPGASGENNFLAFFTAGDRGKTLFPCRKKNLGLLPPEAIFFTLFSAAGEKFLGDPYHYPLWGTQGGASRPLYLTLVMASSSS